MHSMQCLLVKAAKNLQYLFSFFAKRGGRGWGGISEKKTAFLKRYFSENQNQSPALKTCLHLVWSVFSISLAIKTALEVPEGLQF